MTVCCPGCNRGQQTVSGVSRPIFKRYNRVYTIIGAYYSFRWLCVVLDVIEDNRQFRAYLGPSSRGTTVCIQQLVLIIFFRWLCVVLDVIEDSRQFRAYLGPSSGGTTVCIQQLILIFLFRWLCVVLNSIQDNRQSSKKKNKYQLLYTYSCTSWW